MDSLASKDIAYYAEGLSRLVRVPTVSNTDDAVFEKLHAVMAELFPLVFKNTEIVKVHNNALLFKWKGVSVDKPLVLMGHQDVVPAGPEAGWKYPSFSGAIAEGKIWGRGAIDCKGPVFTELQAVEELMEEGFVPQSDVYLSFGDNEEVFGPSAGYAKDYLRDHGIKPYIVLDEGGAIIKEVFAGIDKPFCVIGVYEKGFADVKFKAKSAGGHSSMPPKNTPIARLSAFVHDIETHNYFRMYMDSVAERMLGSFAKSLSGVFKAILSNLKLFKPLLVKLLPKISGFGRALLSTTIAFTMCKGSDATNVLPEEAYIIGNIRFSKHQGSEECFKILKSVADKYNVEMEVLRSRDASPSVDIDGEGYKYVEDCARKIFPDYGVAPYILMGGTDCRFFQEICDNAMRFSPLFLDPQQLAANHTCNENIGVDSVKEGVSFYKYFIKNNK